MMARLALCATESNPGATLSDSCGTETQPELWRFETVSVNVNMQGRLFVRYR